MRDRSTPLAVLMLEDDHERIERFHTILGLHPVGYQLHVERTAEDFCQAFTAWPGGDLIALDHDLFVDDPADPDPGDGRDVARFLATQKPTSPVLIHSTNAPAAESMQLTLADAGWRVDRIAPLGSDWIENYWYPYVIDFLNGQHGLEQR